jgi:TetR/AcrR family transcriptional repressor of nem operon
MPRQREFDPHTALQIAIDMFWENGYFDTSVDQIVKRTGVAKYGIYGTFGTKRELFKKVLTQYASDRYKDIQRPIRKPDAALSEVLEFFDSIPKLATKKNHQFGCLIVNTGIELGVRDPEIGKFVKEFFSDTGGTLRQCLERAVDRGQLSRSTDIASVATYLVTEFRTSLMLAASGHSRREIQKHLEVALHVLR